MLWEELMSAWSLWLNLESHSSDGLRFLDIFQFSGMELCGLVGVERQFGLLQTNSARLVTSLLSVAPKRGGATLFYGLRHIERLPRPVRHFSESGWPSASEGPIITLSRPNIGVTWVCCRRRPESLMVTPCGSSTRCPGFVRFPVGPPLVSCVS